MSLDLFSPYGTDTTLLAVTGTTVSGALNLPSASTDLSGASSGAARSFNASSTVRVYNAANVVVFVNFGISTVTATTSHMPIPPGVVETFQLSRIATHIAAITAGGTGNLYATPGMGA